MQSAAAPAGSGGISVYETLSRTCHLLSFFSPSLWSKWVEALPNFPASFHHGSPFSWYDLRRRDVIDRRQKQAGQYYKIRGQPVP